MFTVKPSRSTVVSQSVLVLGARIGMASVSPGPIKRMWSEAREAEATSAD